MTGLERNFKVYKNFYGFNKTPFNTTPDSRFFYSSPIHEEALANLQYVINERKGFALITGEIGAGKTTLCRKLLNSLPPETKTAVITNTHLTAKALMEEVCQEFELPVKGNKAKLLSSLNNFLIEQLSKNNNVVLIVDEAQNLTPSVMEEIRLISNLETETEKLIQIIIMGQPELRKKICSPKLMQLNQRLTVRYHLHALNFDETKKYIAHRLAIAGPSRTVKFYDDAIDEIYEYSKGIPRLINIVCERALLNGYTRGTHEIYKDVVNEVIHDLEDFQREHVLEPHMHRLSRWQKFKLFLRRLFIRPFQRIVEKF